MAVDDDDDDVTGVSCLFVSQHSVVDLPGEAVLDAGETRSSQQGCILSSRALPALRLHQHVQGVELRRQRARSILVQQRLHQQHAASCRQQEYLLATFKNAIICAQLTRRSFISTEKHTYTHTSALIFFFGGSLGQPVRCTYRPGLQASWTLRSSSVQRWSVQSWRILARM